MEKVKQWEFNREYQDLDLKRQAYQFGLVAHIENLNFIFFA